MEKKKEIERLKQEMAYFLKIARKLKFPKEEVERQINKYLDDINDLKNTKNK